MSQVQIETITKDDATLLMSEYEKSCSNFDWENAEKEVTWFDDGTLNIGYNCFDKHLGTEVENKTAVIWESVSGQVERYTYGEFAKLANKVSNALVDLGIEKGDRVFLFLPRIPEVFTCFTGISKMGGIVGTLFAAFGNDALVDRLGNSEAIAVITTPELKARIDEVRDRLPNLKHIIVIDHRNKDYEVTEDEVGFSKITRDASDEFEAVHTLPEDYAFMLYTSGTTGKSKGIVHSHYSIVQQHLTGKVIMDFKPDDIYFPTADHGWVTGIVYGIIAPFSYGVTQVSYEGRFEAAKWYEVIDKYKATIFYTAPTAIRMLMKSGEDIAKQYSFKSLRHILSVGEPLNPEAIRWGMKVFGLPFHDNWWQTETGAQMISNFPFMDIKLGSMGRPLPGIKAAIVDDNGVEQPPGSHGILAVKPGWPSQMKTVWKNKEKWDEYFKINGWYSTGDKAYIDNEGYFWFIGRADDVIMTSGERIGPFEVESALVEHPAVAEAGVIGKPDVLRGEIIKAFISLTDGVEPSDELLEEIKIFVKKNLAGHAYPREIEIVKSLPKTRSGKIMRRVLKARELGLPEGDTTTLEED